MTATNPTVPRLETFGCRLNAFESEVIRSYQPQDATGERIIFNTCAVTAEAERQARQAIRRARRDHPRAEIVVTGCAAQIDPLRYQRMPEVDRVVGNTEKLQPETWNAVPSSDLVISDIMRVREPVAHPVSSFEGRARACVQIQQGCDHRCTFCVIPYGRGNNRSLPIGEIVRQTRVLVANGFHELVLTGVDIASFGADLPGRPGLAQLLRRLLAQVPELPRLRLSSLDPVGVDDAFLDLVECQPRLMPHLHLSVQSGDNLILKRMKRRHSREDVIRIAGQLRQRRPDIVLGADLIAGFPTESDAGFRNTLDLVAQAGLTHLHVFPYSQRTGTPAARMPQVAKAIRKFRAARLRDAGRMALDGYLSGRIGARERVLVEDQGAGRTEHYAPIVVDDCTEPGTIVEVTVDGVRDGRLSGKITS